MGKFYLFRPTSEGNMLSSRVTKWPHCGVPLDGLIPFIISCPHSTTSASWDRIPSKHLTLRSSSQFLPLGEYKNGANLKIDETIRLCIHNTLKSKAEGKELGDIRVNTGGKKIFKKTIKMSREISRDVASTKQEGAIKKMSNENKKMFLELSDMTDEMLKKNQYMSCR